MMTLIRLMGTMALILTIGVDFDSADDFDDGVDAEDDSEDEEDDEEDDSEE